MSGSIFAIVAIKDTGELCNLLSYECSFSDLLISSIAEEIDYEKKKKKNVGLIVTRKIYRSRRVML